MLTIYPSTSLARRIKVAPDYIAPQPSDHPLAVWCARDFRIGTHQLVLFMNPTTTLPIVLAAAPHKALIERFRAMLPGHLTDLGWAEARETLAPILAQGTEYCRDGDHSVTGMMNQLLDDLEWACKSGRLSADSPMDMTQRLSEILIGGSLPGGYKFPIERFREWVGSPRPPQAALRLVR